MGGRLRLKYFKGEKQKCMSEKFRIAYNSDSIIAEQSELSSLCLFDDQVGIALF